MHNLCSPFFLFLLFMFIVFFTYILSGSSHRTGVVARSGIRGVLGGKEEKTFHFPLSCLTHFDFSSGNILTSSCCTGGRRPATVSTSFASFLLRWRRCVMLSLVLPAFISSCSATFRFSSFGGCYEGEKVLPCVSLVDVLYLRKFNA
uniref:Uncharacterized protein n=1 Tax=Trypanosoma congolense (strain IL3000) TaxID=1068625 RepID=G0UP24_TRYCI|nr:hypothetical protein, unlikely [Trypanosoma congolense IL3000]